MTQVNDIGVRIILTIYEDGEVLDISSASIKSIIIQKPDGTTTTTHTATFYTNGTDGKIYYDTVDGDLDQNGLYRTQALITLSSNTYRSNVVSFRVECNL